MEFKDGSALTQRASIADCYSDEQAEGDEEAKTWGRMLVENQRPESRGVTIQSADLGNLRLAMGGVLLNAGWRVVEMTGPARVR